MRRKRGIELLGILIIFFFTAYVAFIASNVQSKKQDANSQEIGQSKKVNSADSSSIELAKKLYRKASSEHLEAKQAMRNKALNK